VLFSDAALLRLSAAEAELRTSECRARSDALAHCLETLPEGERRLVRLRYEGDRSIQDIAKQEKRTVGAIYTALSRIRKALLACVERRAAKEAV
jgi:RNA polymerase sigma-70 factor (ECF subfamily)